MTNPTELTLAERLLDRQKRLDLEREAEQACLPRGCPGRGSSSNERSDTKNICCHRLPFWAVVRLIPTRSPKPQHVEPIRLAGAVPVRVAASEFRSESPIQSNACPFLRVTDDPLVAGLEGATKEVGFEDRPEPSAFVLPQDRRREHIERAALCKGSEICPAFGIFVSKHGLHRDSVGLADQSPPPRP